VHAGSANPRPDGHEQDSLLHEVKRSNIRFGHVVRAVEELSNATMLLEFVVDGGVAVEVSDIVVAAAGNDAVAADLAYVVEASHHLVLLLIRADVEHMGAVPCPRQRVHNHRSV